MSERIHLDRPESVTVEIPPDMLAALEGCQDSVGGRNGKQFTPVEDAAILKYYPLKRKEDLARVFHCCAETMRKRYNTLIEMEENNGL